MRVHWHCFPTAGMRACGEQKSRCRRTGHRGFWNPQLALPDLPIRVGNAASRISGVDHHAGGIDDQPVIECRMIGGDDAAIELLEIVS